MACGCRTVEANMLVEADSETCSESDSDSYDNGEASHDECYDDSDPDSE